MSLPSSTTAARRRVSRLAAAVGVVLAGLGAACTDAPSAPAAAEPPQPPVPSFSKARGGRGVSEGVLRATPITDTIRVRYTIDPRKSGSFTLPGTGLTVQVPSNAVAEPVEITATAYPGNTIAYDFQPHGLVFRRPLRATHDLRAIDYRSVNFSQILSLDIAYVPDGSQVRLAGVPFDVHAFLAADFDFRDWTVTFDVEHFSGYIVAWGRSRTY